MKEGKRLQMGVKLAGAAVGLVVMYPVCALLLYVLPTLPDTLADLRRQTPFWHAYGNTLAVCGAALLVQFAVGILGGYALAKCAFPGRRLLFWVCVIALLLPIQALILPQYLMLDFLQLLDTPAALIVTGGFSPFGVLLMWYGFDRIPEETIEAAYCEGAGTRRILFRVALPMAKPYLAALMLISLSDLWNMLEQPMAFLKSEASYPLSVHLAQIPASAAALRYTECLLAVLPLLLIFGLIFKKAYRDD